MFLYLHQIFDAFKVFITYLLIYLSYFKVVLLQDTPFKTPSPF